MNSSNGNSPRPDPTVDSKTPLSARFENPLVKVSIRRGVISNRIEKFWTEQTIQIKE